MSIRQKQLRYQITLNQVGTSYAVEDSQFIYDFTPEYELSSSPEEVKDIDSVVRSSLPQKLPEGYKLTKFERDDPYFKFFYASGSK